MARILLSLGYSATEIAKWLNINRSTVYRSNKISTNEELQQFATEVKAAFTVKQYEIVARVLSRVDVLVKKSFNLDSLVKILNTIGADVMLNGREKIGASMTDPKPIYTHEKISDRVEDTRT